jgi:hypothetical protein
VFDSNVFYLCILCALPTPTQSPASHPAYGKRPRASPSRFGDARGRCVLEHRRCCDVLDVLRHAAMSQSVLELEDALRPPCGALRPARRPLALAMIRNSRGRRNACSLLCSRVLYHWKCRRYLCDLPGCALGPARRPPAIPMIRRMHGGHRSCNDTAYTWWPPILQRCGVSKASSSIPISVGPSAASQAVPSVPRGARRPQSRAQLTTMMATIKPTSTSSRHLPGWGG